MDTGMGPPAYQIGSFNTLQSQCLLFDTSMVIGGADRCEKDALFLLSMKRTCAKFMSTDGKFSNEKGTLKMIYVASSKALVSKMASDLSNKFLAVDMKSLELTDVENCNTRAIHDFTIILTTPEVFDVLVDRCIKDGGLSFRGDVVLVLVDEVHLLTDPYGAALEAKVKQMNPGARFLAISSTIPNVEEHQARFLATSSTIPNVNTNVEEHQKALWIMIDKYEYKLRRGEESVFDEGWAIIPRDLLAKIGNKCFMLEDLLAITLTCGSWRHNASQYRFVKTVPILMVIEKNDRSLWEFYTLSNRKITSTAALPESQDRRCTDVGFGWVMALSSSGDIFLFNPFFSSSSSVRIKVPNFTTFPGYQEEFSGDTGIYITARGLLSSDPMKPSKFTLVLVIVGRGLGFWRDGDAGWTRLSSSPQNVCFLLDKLYAFSWTSNGVEVWDINQDHSHSQPIQTLKPKPGILPFPPFPEPYLVVSTGGELLVLFRQNDVCNSDVGLGAKIFSILRMDIATGHCETLTTLGEDAVFIGDNAAVSFNATQFPGVLKRNCIYFTDDRDRYFTPIENCFAHGYDLGIFRVADMVVERFGIPWEKGERTFPAEFSLSPFWVSPSLWV